MLKDRLVISVFSANEAKNDFSVVSIDGMSPIEFTELDKIPPMYVRSLVEFSASNAGVTRKRSTEIQKKQFEISTYEIHSHPGVTESLRQDLFRHLLLLNEMKESGLPENLDDAFFDNRIEDAISSLDQLLSARRKLGVKR